MKNMLECLTIASLKKLAENKEIPFKGSVSKFNIVDAILPVIEKLPSNPFRLYHSLKDEDKDFINYLLVHEKKSNLSQIFKLTQPKRWHGPDMNDIKSILTKLIPTGLVCFEPPPLYYWGNRKEEEYYFYVHEKIKKTLLAYIINPISKAPEPESMKSQSVGDVIKAILLEKIDKCIAEELPDTILELSTSMENSINIDGFGIYSNHRKRYLGDTVTLCNSLIAVAIANLSAPEKRLYSFVSNLSADKWFNEEDVLKIINKYTPGQKCTQKTNVRLQDLGLIKTGKSNSLNLISHVTEQPWREVRKPVPTANLKFDNKLRKLYIEQNALKELSIKELFTILKYFHLSKDNKKYMVTLSLQKVGHALESGEDIALIKRVVTESISLSGELEKTFVDIEKSFGNFLLHKNIVVYRLNDPSIYYKIEKSPRIKTPVSYLEGKYLSIPAREQKDVEQFIKQAGFVIKEENA